MNTTPTINVTEHGPEVGVATARLLLQHALKEAEQTKADDHPELAAKRAVNELTGASVHLPPKEHVMPIWDMSPKDDVANWDMSPKDDVANPLIVVPEEVPIITALLEEDDDDDALLAQPRQA